MSIVKIPEELRKKYANNVPGKLEFVFHIISISLEKTNILLDQENMKSFQYYHDKENRERYPDEFNYVCTVFEDVLRELQEEITNDILSGIFGGKD